MKKILALVLALMLMALTPLALAETVKLTENASGFDLTIDIPDDATVSMETYDEVPYTFITFADATLPNIYLSVAATEEYDVASIADLSKADQETLFGVISADFDDPSYKIKKSDGGYDYMQVDDNSQSDSSMLVVLYNGYFIQMSVWDQAYAVLTTEDIKAAESLIDTLKIVNVE